MTKIVAAAARATPRSSASTERKVDWGQVEHKRTGKREYARRQGGKLILRSKSVAPEGSPEREEGHNEERAPNNGTSEGEGTTGRRKRRGVGRRSTTTLEDRGRGDKTVRKCDFS